MSSSGDFGYFGFIFGQRIDSKPFYFFKGFTQKISSKIKFLAKVNIVPPGGPTVPELFWFMVNSGMLVVIKNMLGLCG